MPVVDIHQVFGRVGSIARAANEPLFRQRYAVLRITPQEASGANYGCPSNVVEAAAYLILLLYLNSTPYKRRRTPELNARDQQIWVWYTSGVHPNDIAARVGVTPPRVCQIIAKKENT